MVFDETAQELLRLNQRMLESIVKANWLAYAELCDPSLSAFEPEAVGHLIEGMEFHRYYFGLHPGDAKVNITMCSPKVRLLGDVAVVSYVRLDQRTDSTGKPFTVAFDETRVWHRQEGRWKHVHFHRSVAQ